MKIRVSTNNNNWASMKEGVTNFDATLHEFTFFQGGPVWIKLNLINSSRTKRGRDNQHT
jgi:hypothetical protein